MRKKPLGFLTIPGLITALLTVLIVIGVGFIRGGVLFSPGALNAEVGEALGGAASHAELQGKCSACHAFFWQSATMADRCVECHADVAAQLKDPSTLHGSQMTKNPAMQCRSCHPEHHGAHAPLTDLSKADIQHDVFGYSLNAHQIQTDGSPFACKTCHVNGYAKFDQTECITCHQQIDLQFMQSHLQAYSENCLACHDGIDTYGHNFDHSTVAFPLTGKHVSLECPACHSNARSIADMKATPQDCAACHAKDDPHKGQFGTGCDSCHTTTAWLPATFDHSKSGFPLTGAHTSLACSQCHINNVFTNLDTNCVSCHAKDDAHNGQFGTDCGACHTTTAWLPATFDHSKTQFPLTGAHTALECTKCHVNNNFTTLDTACASCHADPAFHLGLFTNLSCDQCHNTSAWSPASFNLAHPISCGEVTCIGHEGAACRDCHAVNLSTATCLKCHDSNNPGDGGGGGGD
jgi:hypothetical protein